jgi:O-antigen biosynthesis protein
MRFSIKICTPAWREAHQRVNYPIAVGLKQCFARHGPAADIQIKPEWANGADRECDAVIHLRGLNRYKVSGNDLFMM